MDSVQAGRLIDDHESYFAFKNTEKGSKRVEFTGNKVKYTITEGIKIFELALANPESASGSSFWLQVQREGILPKRPGESMRNFWKENRLKGLEAYITNAVQDDTRYCHAFKAIPKV